MILTISRICMLPALVLSFYTEDTLMWIIVRVFLFSMLSATDWLDGWLARTLRQETKIGSILDPIADKLLISTTLIMLLAHGTIQEVHGIAVAIIIGRDFLISGLRESLSSENSRVLKVTIISKWKTTFQFIAIATLLGLPIIHTITISSPVIHNLLTIVPFAMLWIATALSLWTCCWYIIKFTKHLLKCTHTHKYLSNRNTT